MTNVLQTSFTHSYNGQETYEILNNAFQSQYSILGDWKVLTDIVSKRNLYYSEGNNKILKPYSNTWNNPNAGIPLSDRIISVEDMEINLNLSRDQIKSTAWEEITKSGALRDNLSQTPILDFLTQQIQTGLHNDVLRQVMFNKKTGNSSGSSDYKGFNGLLYALVNNSSVSKFDLSSGGIINTSGELENDAALKTFRYMIENASNKLKVKPLQEKAIYCTPGLYFNFLNTLETGAHDYAKILLQNGQVAYKFRGVEITPVWSWANDIDDTDNPFHSLFTNAAQFCMYTEKKNLVVGTDIGVNESSLQMEYIMYLKQMYIQTQMKLGANIISPYNTFIAY